MSNTRAEKEEILEEDQKDIQENQAPDQQPEDGSEGSEGVGEDGGDKKDGPEDEDLKNQYLRLAADFQNYKRRTEKEKSDIYAYANEKIVTELLDVIDNFERAIAHQGECVGDSMAEGMGMIFKQLKGVLEKNKVEEIQAEGADFDPNYHHAVMTDSSGQYESGKIVEVLQKGYLFSGKVIRPAMVKVAE